MYAGRTVVVVNPVQDGPQVSQEVQNKFTYLDLIFDVKWKIYPVYR